MCEFIVNAVAASSFEFRCFDQKKTKETARIVMEGSAFFRRRFPMCFGLCGRKTSIRFTKKEEARD